MQGTGKSGKGKAEAGKRAGEVPGKRGEVREIAPDSYKFLEARKPGGLKKNAEQGKYGRRLWTILFKELSAKKSKT
jgi:hypothetical protein